ncbi:cold-responsive protein kinase 1-like isoform X1 [Dendrobium catenatum]|uniref:Putative leucine-rich repeat receptor-like serine/threonine-protein kinase n=1 Tax=Dendrobium catenatum TaxID=906689 RepID=A0A2I0X7H9_9ASPA|nr:cold-responsive protein kinase 1-like isoform X1 [Dendrobium catenatum]XP_020682637.1 cold-responsive protein kinase 1-like isoform X1 [Dendrobium catenatum]PKU83862.1 putative leucine-rich repeat receptor-like serine/threonine-protein kinase [Dendrobium catenatum]
MTCCSFILKKSSSRQKDKSDEEVLQNVKIYSYKVLRKATDNFSPANKLGEGGFGCVYKGRLKNGEIVAIKVLSSESRQGVREFLNELTVISNVVHENLVSLIGCCVDGNQRILVYNYLQNNSLAKTLLGTDYSNIQFSWITRRKICIGIARGLKFLHEEVRPHIVHRDIKASNVLLDKDLTPKISDFGIAKLLPADMSHISTKVAGTIGYLAPEYAVRGQLTRKADIYSFGVLLMEIISGRNHTNTRLPYEDQILLERMWTLYKNGKLESIIDTSLDGDFDAEEACRFLKVGLLCTQENPKLRPSMSTVVKILEGEIDVDSFEITEPGMITDFMDLKVRQNNQNLAPLVFSAINSPPEASPKSSGDTTHASMSFTAIIDRA